MFEKQDTRSMSDVHAGVSHEESQQEVKVLGMVPLDLEGFTREEAERLVHARARYRSGQLNESSVDYKRLQFARWLYRQGRIGR